MKLCALIQVNFDLTMKANKGTGRIIFQWAGQLSTTWWFGKFDTEFRLDLMVFVRNDGGQLGHLPLSAKPPPLLPPLRRDHAISPELLKRLAIPPPWLSRIFLCHELQWRRLTGLSFFQLEILRFWVGKAQGSGRQGPKNSSA